MSNKLIQMAREILNIESDLPFRYNYKSGERPTINDFEIHIFEQAWGSTALGFGGVGGQAITLANTYVFVPVSVDQLCFVYFAGEFAYAVPYSNVLMEDIRGQHMESVSRSGKYKHNKE